jgi:hypothetical protein
MPKPEEGADVQAIRISCGARAQMLAALVSVEVSADGGETWEKGALPAAWQGMEEFFAMPGDLSEAWYGEAVALNTGIFTPALTDAEKNADAAIVISLKSAYAR